jgi:hypothetical protein
MPEENDQYSSNQYKQQANSLLSVHNYTPLVTSRNDKNKQLILLSQQRSKSTSRPDFQANTRPTFFESQCHHKIQKQGCKEIQV